MIKHELLLRSKSNPPPHAGKAHGENPARPIGVPCDFNQGDQISSAQWRRRRWREVGSGGDSPAVQRAAISGWSLIDKSGAPTHPQACSPADKSTVGVFPAVIDCWQCGQSEWEGSCAGAAGACLSEGAAQQDIA
jgi:hypothetical protein